VNKLGSGETVAKALRGTTRPSTSGHAVSADSPPTPTTDDLGSSPSSGLGSSAGVSE
jgi:hypothetical protein